MSDEVFKSCTIPGLRSLHALCVVAASTWIGAQLAATIGLAASILHS